MYITQTFLNLYKNNNIGFLTPDYCPIIEMNNQKIRKIPKIVYLKSDNFYFISVQFKI